MHSLCHLAGVVDARGDSVGCLRHQSHVYGLGEILLGLLLGCVLPAVLSLLSLSSEIIILESFGYQGGGQGPVVRAARAPSVIRK
jgi:hypothetical protein